MRAAGRTRKCWVARPPGGVLPEDRRQTRSTASPSSSPAPPASDLLTDGRGLGSPSVPRLDLLPDQSLDPSWDLLAIGIHHLFYIIIYTNISIHVNYRTVRKFSSRINSNHNTVHILFIRSGPHSGLLTKKFETFLHIQDY
jgi:hypothetical protein